MLRNMMFRYLLMITLTCTVMSNIEERGPLTSLNQQSCMKVPTPTFNKLTQMTTYFLERDLFYDIDALKEFVMEVNKTLQEEVIELQKNNTEQLNTLLNNNLCAVKPDSDSNNNTTSHDTISQELTNYQTQTINKFNEMELHHNRTIEDTTSRLDQLEDKLSELLIGQNDTKTILSKILEYHQIDNNKDKQLLMESNDLLQLEIEGLTKDVLDYKQNLSILQATCKSHIDENDTNLNDNEMKDKLNEVVNSQSVQLSTLRTLTELLNSTDCSDKKEQNPILSCTDSKNSDMLKKLIKLQRRLNKQVNRLVYEQENETASSSMTIAQPMFDDKTLEEVKEAWTVQALIEVITTLENEKREMELNLTKYIDLFRPADCWELLQAGFKESGVYSIYPNRCDCIDDINNGTLVWCDQQTRGGGWTVITDRRDDVASENFTRTWLEYKEGFGHPLKEYWIGNEVIHQLTHDRHYVLRVDAKDRVMRHRWAQWGTFKVGNQHHKYQLSIGKFHLSSSLGNSLRRHNKMKFSTIDQDNDFSYDNSCAKMYLGGWWYRRCYDLHPTGMFGSTNQPEGVTISQFTPSVKQFTPLKQIKLMIRPSACETVSHKWKNLL